MPPRLPMQQCVCGERSAGAGAQVCNKIVETERGKAAAFSGNYTEHMRAKLEREAQQFAAWEKWNKEMQKQKDIVRRCVRSMFCKICSVAHWPQSFG